MSSACDIVKVSMARKIHLLNRLRGLLTNQVFPTRYKCCPPPANDYKNPIAHAADTTEMNVKQTYPEKSVSPEVISSRT